MNFLPCFLVIQSSFNANNSLWVISIVFFIKSFKISFASQQWKLLQLTFSGTPNNFFFCKITVKRSKYFLEISTSRKAKMSEYAIPLVSKMYLRFSEVDFYHILLLMKVPLFAPCSRTFDRTHASRKLKVSDETKNHHKLQPSIEATKFPLRLLNRYIVF